MADRLNNHPEFPDFYLPFGGKLDPRNRWNRLAALVPWDVVEAGYRIHPESERFSDNPEGVGAPPLPARVAFGAMIIKERLGCSDEETVAQILENPYLQQFLGYRELLQTKPFDPSMMVHFRKRFDQESYDQINRAIIEEAEKADAEILSNPLPDKAQKTSSSPDISSAEQSPGNSEPPELFPRPNEQEEGVTSPSNPDKDINASTVSNTDRNNIPDTPSEAPENTPVSASVPAADSADTQSQPDQNALPNQGKLLIDASATPADITYPTDLKLLNATREKLEHIIDQFHEPMRGNRPKPRTYRKEARANYLSAVKKKNTKGKTLRTTIRKQLGYVRRNLNHIDKYLDEWGADLSVLSDYDYRCLLFAHEIYRQQAYMYENRTHRIDDRIVSLSQPWVRPIVRGKASAKIEFGAKISISVTGDGYVSLDRMSWDAYNESADLIDQAERYRERTGYWPASIHADSIYRTRANRKWCQERNIRLSGAPLGRPRKETEENKAELKVQKKQTVQDGKDRNAVEGKIGNSKRRGTLARIMAKLCETSVSMINMGFITLNLEKRLARKICALIWRVLRTLSVINPPQIKLRGFRRGLLSGG